MRNELIGWLRIFVTIILSVLQVEGWNQEKGVIKPGDIIFTDPLDHIDQRPSFHQINSIFQDSKGFIWMSCYDGLFRYDGYKFKNFFQVPVGPDDISIPTISAMTEDSRGNIWFGGFRQYGIQRFDPRTEKFIYYPRPGIDPVYLKDSECWSILEDSEKNIWIGSYGYQGKEEWPGGGTGVYKYDYTSDRFKHYFHDPDNPRSIPNNMVFPLLEDSYGNTWMTISTRLEDGLVLYNKEQDAFTTYKLLTQSGDTITVVGILVMEDEDNMLWLADFWNKTIYKIKDDRSDIKTRPYESLRFFKSFDSFKLPGHVWISTYDLVRNLWLSLDGNGLVRFNTANNTWQHFLPDPENPWSISGVSEYSIAFCDNSGGIWYNSVLNGYDYFVPQKQKFEYYSNDFLGFDAWVNALYEDHDSVLWIGTSSGLVRYDQKSGKKTVINDPDQNSINAIVEDKNGNLWVIGGNMLQLYDRKAKTFVNSEKYDVTFPRDLTTDFDNNIWIAGGGLFQFDLEKRKTKMLFNYWRMLDTTDYTGGQTYSIEVSENGKIWIGTEYGLNCYDPKTGKNIAIRHNPDKPNGISGISVSSIIEDRHGNLWVGSRSNGLNFLGKEYIKGKDINPDSLVFKYYSTDNGLPENNIRGLIEDKNGAIWIATLYKIVRFIPSSKEFTVFSKKDGIFMDKIRGNLNFSMGKSTGKIYINGYNSFIAFHPDSIRNNNFVPPIVFTDFKINDRSVEISDTSPLKQSITYTDKIELKHYQNFLSFEFAALSFSDPTENQYKYRMLNLEQDTVYAGTTRTANYKDLKPGKFTFWVTGSNSDGVWNEEGISIDIIIHPPWYKADLAYGSYGLMFVLSIFGFINWRTRSLKKDKEVLEQQVNERTKQIEYQKEEIESQRDELEKTLINLKLTQTQLVQSEKMASLGGLVAGVAHEINTPVGIGVTAVSSLLEETKHIADLYNKEKISRKDFKEFLQTTNNSAKLVQRNLERTAQLIQSFKQVSVDQSTEEQRKFFLKAYLEDVIRSLYPRFKNRDIRINLECDEKLEIRSYPGAFAQIFTNLLLNSITHGFLDEVGGQVEIRVVHDNNKLSINYMDNGKGIPEDILPRIFDPFFTTDQSQGTGLGLNIVYNLITQKLNGTIECESRMNDGVEFKIKIPEDS